MSAADAVSRAPSRSHNGKVPFTAAAGCREAPPPLTDSLHLKITAPVQHESSAHVSGKWLLADAKRTGQKSEAQSETKEFHAFLFLRLQVATVECGGVR